MTERMVFSSLNWNLQVLKCLGHMEIFRIQPQVRQGHPLVDVYDLTITKHIVRRFFLRGVYSSSRDPKENGRIWMRLAWGNIHR